MDEETKNSETVRLVLAKSLYLHGCTHASRTDSVSRMLAIHHFDNAVEMVLKSVATKRGIEPKGKYFYFDELLNKKNELPLKQPMRDLHKVRNSVQHQGDIPSVETIIKYKGYVEDFFKQVCGEIFNIAYTELYLSTLIENDNLREQMLKAEETLSVGNFKQCIELCDDVLTSATFEEADIFHSAGMLTGYWGASKELQTVLREDYLEKYKEKDYHELAKELRGAILQWGQATTGMQFLDEYRMAFLKHREIVEMLENLSDEEIKDNAKFSLNFVTSLILKWQEEGLLN